MLGFGWFGLRQARAAIRGGRLEEAQRLLREAEKDGQTGVSTLLSQLARAYVDRGNRHLRLEDASAAWNDLIAAESLQTGDKTTPRLRETLTRLGVAQVRALLQAGEPARAEEMGGRLRGWQVSSPELHAIEEAARAWLTARELADRGEFTRAVESADQARRLLGPMMVLDQWFDELDKRRQKFADLQRRLFDAADAGRWSEALELAEQVLATAPDHAEARKVRKQAWKAVAPGTVTLGTEREQVATARPDSDTVDGIPTRFLLWIDGVGGYLVCLSPRVALGQAGSEGHVDVPFVADVSRLHATLTRDPEGYLLEGIKAIQVNGLDAMRALLRPGDRVTLGSSCQFLFHQPVPVSATARLDLVSGHRLQYAVEGVLLMADSLVIGPPPQGACVAPGASAAGGDLQKQGRPRGTVSRDDVGERRTARRQGNAASRSIVSGEEISFAIEPVVR